MEGTRNKKQQNRPRQQREKLDEQANDQFVPKNSKIDKAQVEEYFSKFGKVENMVLESSVGGSSKGYCLIKYED